MRYFYSLVISGYRIYPVILLISILMLIFSCSSPESINAKADPLNAIPADQMDPVVLSEKIRENKFSPNGYEALFTHGNLHEIEIVISQGEWNAHIRDMKEYAKKDRDGKGLTGRYRQANFIYHGPLGDVIITDVGFRTKGHYTRPYPEDEMGFHRAHFKIKFNKGFKQTKGSVADVIRNERRFCALRKLDMRSNLQDVRWDISQIRELYCYDLMNRAGVNTSRTGSAKLYITIEGKKHYFGIYTLVEPIDKSFLTKRFGKSGNDGNLYKCLWGDSGPATLEPIDEKFTNNMLFPQKKVIGSKDWTKHYRPTYDLKTNEDLQDHSALITFIERLNTLEGTALRDYCDEHFEIDKFIRCRAMNTLIGRWDNYWAMGNNYYLYFNNAGKIEFIPVDFDMALGGGYMLYNTAEVSIYDWENRSGIFLRLVAPKIPQWMLEKYADYSSPLTRKIFAIGEYKQFRLSHNPIKHPLCY